MSLLRSSSFPFVSWVEELDRIFTFSAPLVSAGRVSVNRSDDGVRVDIEAPGLDVSDISVTVEKSVLKVSAEASEGNDALRTRRSFSYSWDLGYEPDTEKMSATYRAGILTITLPRRAADDTSQVTIPVTNGDK